MGRMDDANAPAGARKKDGGSMRHRDVTVVFILGSLILVSGCGRSPEEPVPAPQASAEQGAAGMQGGGGPAGNAGGAPAGHGVDAVPPLVSSDSDPSAESGSQGEDFADVLVRIRSLMEETDFAAADTLCREAEGMFKDPAHTAELAALATHVRDTKRESSKLRYAVEQLGSPDSTVIGVTTGELLGAGDTGRLFLRHALRAESPAIAGKAARALVMDNDGQAVPLMLDRVTRDTDPLLGREIGAAILRLKKHLTVAQLTHCHALLAGDRTTARHGLLPVLADAFAGVGAGDANRYNAWLSATDGYDALRHYTERLLASGDAGLVAFAAPVAGLIGLTIPGLHVENQINRRFAEAIALPVTAELANLASGNESARTNAYTVLRAAGDLGRAVLYRAVRDGNPAEAKAAATELVVRNDPRAYLVIVDRLAREPETAPLGAVLTRAALQLASFMDPHTCRTLRQEEGAPR
jgi:hypothetical protein